MKSRTYAGQTQGVPEDRRRIPTEPVTSVRTFPVGRHAVREILCGEEISAKLEVGAPGDALEQQADQAADTIMRMPDLSAQIPDDEELPPLVPIQDIPNRPGTADAEGDLAARIRSNLRELASSNPWIPSAAISRAESQLITLYENPSIPNWVMKFKSEDQRWGEFVVLRLYREPMLAGRFHYNIEIYQEFPTTEAIWRTRLSGRSAMHAAAASKNWNEAMFAVISKEMEMRPLEIIKAELRFLQWQYLIVEFLRAVVGAAASFYPRY